MACCSAAVLCRPCGCRRASKEIQIVSSGDTEQVTAGGPIVSNGEQPKACLASRQPFRRSTG